MPRTFVAFLSLTLTAACGFDVAEPRGADLYLAQCASCHGRDGKGGGPAAAGLSVAPPDLTRIAARRGGVFDRDRVASIIDGLDRGAHFDPAMPEFGAGDLGPLVMLDEGGTPVPIPADLLALTDYLQTLQE